MGLLPRVPMRFVTPVLVAAELRPRGAPSRADLEASGVRFMRITQTMTADAVELSARYGPSIVDMSAAVLAGRLRCTLLTGDNSLRRAATVEGIPVHGTLWLLARMVDAGVLDRSAAFRAHRDMVAAGRRLPALDLPQ
ncbi:MAG: PIN domain-containing protein [Candidatus Poribacteria bacterium]